MSKIKITFNQILGVIIFSVIKVWKWNLNQIIQVPNYPCACLQGAYVIRQRKVYKFAISRRGDYVTDSMRLHELVISNYCFNVRHPLLIATVTCSCGCYFYIPPPLRKWISKEERNQLQMVVLFKTFCIIILFSNRKSI